MDKLMPTETELRNLYWRKKLSIRDIGKIYNAEYGKARHWLFKLNIPRRGHPESALLAMKKHRGENHSNWKGGKIKSTSGYVIIYSPNHPHKDMRGYVKRCILIVEKALGRYLNLEKKEIVHHINGIKDDDRNENLLVCDNSYHGFIEMRIRIRRQYG